MILKNLVCVCLLGYSSPGPVRAAALQAGQSRCNPALAARFTPRHPQLGRYEVCEDPERIEKAVPEGWTIEKENPLDAFGGAPLDRSRLTRLYGGSEVRIARGWMRAGQGLESVTFISPYPAPDFTRLEPGTLVIRWISASPQIDPH